MHAAVCRCRWITITSCNTLLLFFLVVINSAACALVQVLFTTASVSHAYSLEHMGIRDRKSTYQSDDCCFTRVYSKMCISSDESLLEMAMFLLSNGMELQRNCRKRGRSRRTQQGRNGKVKREEGYRDGTPPRRKSQRKEEATKSHSPLRCSACL